MLTLIRVLIFCIFTIIFPCLLGKLIWEESKTAPESLIYYFLCGETIFLSFLYILCFIMTLFKAPLTNFIYTLFTVEFITVILVSIWKYRELYTFLSDIYFKFRKLRLQTWFLVILIIIIAITTVLFGKNNPNDNAPETAITAWYTNSMFQYNPFTGEKYEMLPIIEIKSPYAIIYAISAKVIGKNPVVLIKFFWPVLIIFFAFSSVYLTAKKLFHNHQHSAFIFMIIYITMNILGFSGENGQAEMLLIQPWQGNSILTNIWIPFIYYQGLIFLEFSETNKIISKQSLKPGLLLILTGIVFQLFCKIGFFLWGIIISIFIMIFLGRKGLIYVRSHSPN